MSLKVLVYSYSACNTCRRALNWLREMKIDHEVIDIVKTPPTIEILQSAFDQLSSRKLLFNTSGVSYRKIGASVIKSMSDQEALEALAGDGKLIKRPFLITGKGKILVGFKMDDWSNLFMN